MSEITPLPDGYTYAELIEPYQDDATALIKHMPGTEWVGDYMELRQDWVEPYSADIHDVAVLAGKGALVGFGSLYVEKDRGLLADFVVDPKHRSRGIGKAIILERMRIADNLGLRSVELTGIDDTNTLPTFYLQQGFRIQPNGLWIIGPDDRPGPFWREQ